MLDNYRIIDISQPVSSSTACFPGDTPFSKEIMLTYAESKVVNLTALTMSPHVGSHTDAPVHVQGAIGDKGSSVGELPLDAYVGPAYVLDLSPIREAITPEIACVRLEKVNPSPKRVLFKTAKEIRYSVFEEEYAFFSVELIRALGKMGVKLIGIDCPSVDHTRSKGLEVHHELIQYSFSWLENLDLTRAQEGEYFLVALPIKFMELEASPVRAVLLQPN